MLNIILTQKIQYIYAMLAKLTTPYKGLSTEVWLLALVTLINRAGAMVIPFMSLYLTNYLNFSLGQVGWIMTCFGIGSVFGVYLGGKLSDKIGYYKVMYGSLILTGLMFFILQVITQFYLICLGVMCLSLIADAFRPAMWVALSDYSKEANRTRSVTLVRLAINLGFSMGPALGGFIIANISYQGLFWIDGLTCLIAGIIIFKALYQKNNVEEDNTTKEQVIKLSPFKDKQFIIFWFAMFLIGFTFMQYFSTLPIYYNEKLYLSEDQIGMLLSLNGLLIFFFEMPIVHYFESSKLTKIKLVILGTFLLVLSFFVLNISPWVGMAVVGMILMSFGEILGFPFSNAYAMNRSKKGNQGTYMAMYSMTFSVAHILGPNIGMHLTENYGFAFTWYVMAALLLISCSLLYWLHTFIQD